MYALNASRRARDGRFPRRRGVCGGNSPGGQAGYGGEVAAVCCRNFPGGQAGYGGEG